MQRLLLLFGSLALACAAEPAPFVEAPTPIPAPVPEPTIEPMAIEPMPFAPIEPIEPIDLIDDREQIYRWNCHPREVARFEFARDEAGVPRKAEPEFERLVDSWNEPPGPDGPVAKILIMGWRSEGEEESIDDTRAEAIRSGLIEAGAPPELLLAAGYDVGSRVVTVQLVCGICCIL